MHGHAAVSAFVPRPNAYAVNVADTFSKAVRLMRKHDPQSQEAGFGMLAPIAAVLPQLIAEFEAESDQGLRCWLLELIGHAQSPSALPILSRELGNDDDSLRGWARRGLERLDTSEARSVLWRDAQNQSR